MRSPAKQAYEDLLAIVDGEWAAMRTDRSDASRAQVCQQRALLRQAQRLSSPDRSPTGQRDGDVVAPVVTLNCRVLRQFAHKGRHIMRRARHMGKRPHQEDAAPKRLALQS